MSQTVAEKESLQEEIRLLRVQLQSLENILQLQEKAAGASVTMVKNKASAATREHNHKPKDHAGYAERLIYIIKVALSLPNVD